MKNTSTDSGSPSTTSVKEVRGTSSPTPKCATRQHGELRFRLANLCEDMALLEAAQKAAKENGAKALPGCRHARRQMILFSGNWYGIIISFLFFNFRNDIIVSL